MKLAYFVTGGMEHMIKEIKLKQKIERSVPRILIGTPVYEKKRYITQEWIAAVKNLSYKKYNIMVIDNGEYNKEFHNLFRKNKIKLITSRNYKNPIKRLTNARTKLFRYAINKSYDFILSIEQDIIVPENIIQELLKVNKDVVGAPYVVSSHTDKNRRRIDYIISASNLNKICGKIDGIEINEWMLAGELSKNKLMTVKSCSFGCTLISTKILKIIKPHSNPSILRADDSYFFQDCKDKEIPVYITPRLFGQIRHIKELCGELQVGGKLK